MSEKSLVLKPEALKSFLEGPKFEQALQSVLPDSVKAERFIKVALTSMTKNPKLKECTQLSIIASLMSLAQLNLEADGYHAYLIPRWNSKAKEMQCTYMIDYKGYVELVMRSGKVSSIHAEVVRENDFFEYHNGQVKHSPDIFSKDRGEILGIWCGVTMKDGSVKYEAMSKDAIELIRKRGQDSDFSPWKTDWEEMGKKTVFHRCKKWLPISPEYRRAFDDFDRLPEIQATVVNEPRKLTRGGEEIHVENQSE